MRGRRLERLDVNIIHPCSISSRRAMVYRRSEGVRGARRVRSRLAEGFRRSPLLTGYLCKRRYRYALLRRNILPVEFDTLDFMQRLSGKIAFTTMRATKYRYIFDHQ